MIIDTLASWSLIFAVITLAIMMLSGKKHEAVPFNYTAPGYGYPSQRHYSFDIVNTRNGYRAYIRSSPNYRNRNTDLHSTHRMYDGQYYVCWTNKVFSEADMKAIARHWSNCTQAYIDRGIRF